MVAALEPPVRVGEAAMAVDAIVVVGACADAASTLAGAIAPAVAPAVEAGLGRGPGELVRTTEPLK
jgi:hypothetical protein